jgi:hypothetical protein
MQSIAGFMFFCDRGGGGGIAYYDEILLVLSIKLKVIVCSMGFVMVLWRILFVLWLYCGNTVKY